MRLNPRLVLDICAESFLALQDNRLRSILSVLGITAGIAAVMTVGIVSKGGRFVVFSELETFGLKSVWVYRNYTDKDPNRAVRAGTGIKAADYIAIRATNISTVRLISPIVYDKNNEIRASWGNNYSNARVTGVGADYLEINNDALMHGRQFLRQDLTRKRQVAIIGTEIQKDLFGLLSNPVGREIRLGKRKFTIIGVLAEKSRDFLASIGSAGGQDANNRLLIPYSVFQQMTGSKDIDVLHAEVTALANAEIAASRIKRILIGRHRSRYDYKSDTMAQYIQTADNILRLVTLIGVVAASVSLFVGGMGIVNIMSTSVLERTREIGVRKALGASRGQILLQFLMEAIFISLTGGFLGLIVGMGLGQVVVLFTGIALSISWPAVFISLAVSVCVGLISGFYPAHRASNLKPVEALRHE
jgi:putative ABC transport system permease protein